MTQNDFQDYVRNYDRAVYRLMASGRAAPSEARLTRFEDSIGFRFPEEFRQLTLSPLGGLCFEVSEEIWSRPRPEEDEDWKGLYGIHVFGLGIGAPSWLDLQYEVAALPEEESDLVPFMGIGNHPDRYCFDLDHQIVLWSQADGSREVLDEGLYPLLMRLVGELEERWVLFQEARKLKKKPAKRKKAKAKAKAS